MFRVRAMVRRPSLALLAWIASLLAGFAVLAQPATPALSPPPLTHPAKWSAWASQRTPVDATLALVRIFAIGAGGYLAAITALTLLARASGRVRLIRLTGLLTVPALRPLLFGVATLSVTSSPAFAQSARPAPPVMVAVQQDEPRPTVPPPVMRQLVPPSPAP